MDDAKLGRAIRLHRHGALEQAVDCHRRALALTPESGGAHGILGQTLFRFGRFADAEASYRCALAVEDFSADLDAGPDALVDTAVLMMSLDLVITTDTALAHLAGALGHPTWILLKRHAEWRWLLDRADSP